MWPFNKKKETNAHASILHLQDGDVVMFNEKKETNAHAPVASEFTAMTIVGPIRTVIPISELAGTVGKIYKIYNANFDFEGGPITKMIGCSVVSVCPQCGNAAMGEELLKFQLFLNFYRPGKGDGSSALERLASGRCGNGRCSSRNIEIISRPDLDETLQKYVSQKGVNIEVMRQNISKFKIKNKNLE